MSLAKDVMDILAGLPPERATAQALVEAERLADLFADVRVVPYKVPIERFAGMTYTIKTENNA